MLGAAVSSWGLWGLHTAADGDEYAWDRYDLPSLWQDYHIWWVGEEGDHEDSKQSIQEWSNVESYLHENHGLPHAGFDKTIRTSVGGEDWDRYYEHPATVAMAKLHSLAQGKNFFDDDPSHQTFSDDEVLQGAALGLLKIRRNQHNQIRTENGLYPTASTAPFKKVVRKGLPVKRVPPVRVQQQPVKSTPTMPTPKEKPIGQNDDIPDDASVLYRGVLLDLNSPGLEKVRDILHQTGDYKHPDLGSHLVDYMASGADRNEEGVEHWSVDPFVAENFAGNPSRGDRTHIPMLMKAHWYGQGGHQQFADDHIDWEGGKWGSEMEVPLQPGAPLHMQKIVLRHPDTHDWHHVLGEPRHTTAATDGIRYAHVVEADVAEDLMRLAMPKPTPEGITFHHHPTDDTIPTEPWAGSPESTVMVHKFSAPAVEARHNGETVGYLEYSPSLSVNGMSWAEYGNHPPEIGMIKVRRGYQRHGIATALFDFARQHEPELQHSDARTPDGEGWSAYEKSRHAGLNGDLPEGLTFQHHPAGFEPFPDVIMPTVDVSSAWPTVSAHDGDKMIGHLQWDDSHPRKRGQIWDLRVHPDYQRRGVATALFDWTTDNVEPDLQHSNNLSDEGRAFAESEVKRPLAEERYEAWRNGQPMPKRFAMAWDQWAPKIQHERDSASHVLTNKWPSSNGTYVIWHPEEPDHGGMNYRWNQHPQKGAYSALAYTLRGDSPSALVNLISTHPNHRSDGVAEALMRRLHEDHPGVRIDPGNMTDDGQGLLDGLKKRIPQAGDALVPRHAAVTQNLVDRLHDEFKDWRRQQPKGSIFGGGMIGGLNEWPNIERFLKDRYPAAYRNLSMGHEQAGLLMDGIHPSGIEGGDPYSTDHNPDASFAPYETGLEAEAKHGYDPKEIAAGMLLLHNKTDRFRGDMSHEDQARLNDIAQKRYQMQRTYEQRQPPPVTARLAMAWDEWKDKIEHKTHTLTWATFPSEETGTYKINHGPDESWLSYGWGEEENGDPVVNVQKLNTAEKFRNRGVAEALMRRLHQDNPGIRINPGGMTEMGQAFHDRMLEKEPDARGVLARLAMAWDTWSPQIKGGCDNGCDHDRMMMGEYSIDHPSGSGDHIPGLKGRSLLQFNHDTDQHGNPELYVSGIHVDENHRRDGVAEALMRRMHQDHPDTPINPGFTTDDGQGLLDGLKKRIPQAGEALVPRFGSRLAMPAVDAWDSHVKPEHRDTDQLIKPGPYFHATDQLLNPGDTILPLRDVQDKIPTSRGRQQNYADMGYDNHANWVWMMRHPAETSGYGKYIYHVQPEVEGPWSWNNEAYYDGEDYPNHKFVAPRARVIQQMHPDEYGYYSLPDEDGDHHTASIVRRDGEDDVVGCPSCLTESLADDYGHGGHCPVCGQFNFEYDEHRHGSLRVAMPRQDAYNPYWKPEDRETEEPTYPKDQVWYHRSDHDLPDGTMLTPGGGKSKWENVYKEDAYGTSNHQNWVWMYPPDMDWFFDHGTGKHKYEVQPEVEGPYPWNNDDSQYVAPRARIIRKISPGEDTQAGEALVPRFGRLAAAIAENLLNSLHGQFHDWWGSGGGTKIDGEETADDDMLDPHIQRVLNTMSPDQVAKYYQDLKKITRDVAKPPENPLGSWPTIEQFMKEHYPAAHRPGFYMGMEQAQPLIDGKGMFGDPVPDEDPYETGPHAVARHGYDPKEVAAGMLLLHNRAHGMRSDLESADIDRLSDITQKRIRMQRNYEQRQQPVTARLAMATQPDLYLHPSEIRQYANPENGFKRFTFPKFKQQVFEDGAIHEPVRINTDGEHAYLADGHHRVQAADELGLDRVPVYVTRDTMEPSIDPQVGGGLKAWISGGGRLREPGWDLEDDDHHTAARTAMPAIDAYDTDAISPRKPFPQVPQGPWYHGSDHDLPEETVLTPGGGDSRFNDIYDSGWENRPNWLWMTNTPELARQYGQHIYEVEPLDEGPWPWNGHASGSDYVSPRARIVRKISPGEDTP